MVGHMGGFITLSKVEKKMDVLDVFAGLGEALREKGYDSEAKITELIDEVKEEVTEEWIKNREFIKKSVDTANFNCLTPNEFVMKMMEKESSASAKRWTRGSTITKMNLCIVQ